MVRALRRTRLAPLFAAVALFAMTPVTVTSLLHDESDDAICNPAVVIHDANNHHVTSSDRNSSLPDSQHCVLCHTLQSLRAVSNAIGFVAPSADARLVRAAAAGPLSSLFQSSRPARAPPAFA